MPTSSGGCPYLDDDLVAATDVLLGVAADFGVGVDLHTDETLDPTVDGLSELCHAVLAGFAHPVTASHCVSLGQRPHVDQRRVADLVAEAGVNVVALPHTNLFLLGRGTAPMPRGLTAVAALHEAGVDRRRRCRQPAGPVQSGRACLPVRDRRVDDHGRPPPPARGLAGSLVGAGLRARVTGRRRSPWALRRT